MSSFGSVAFRWLWCSSLASSLGMGMYMTATAWLALASAGGPFTVGLVMAVRMLPNLLFGLTAGTLGDRANRNRLLVGVSLGVIPLTLGLSALASQQNVEVWQLLALVFSIATLTVFGIPARQALVMDTVPRDVAPNAMALNATAGLMCTALGAVIAGALIPAAGVSSCYLAVAAAHALAAALVAFVRPGESSIRRTLTTNPPFTKALAEGVRMMFDIPALSDQHYGGLIIWLPGTLLSLLAIILVLINMRRNEEGGAHVAV